jgi:hypothetical protein
MQQRIISDIETCNQQRDIPPRILLPRRARAGRDLAGRARSATPECDLRARGDRSRPLHPGRLGGPHGCIARPAGSSDWSARLRRLGAARRRYDCRGSRPRTGPHQDRAIMGGGTRRAHLAEQRRRVHSTATRPIGAPNMPRRCSAVAAASCTPTAMPASTACLRMTRRAGSHASPK